MSSQQRNFLIIGIVNTIFGYFTGIFLYFLLFKFFGIIVVGIITNIISITFSFITFKFFFFKTINSNWLKEYFKGYVVYGAKAIISIFILWLCINKFELNIFVSQAIAILVTTIITYKGHKSFTFKVK